MCGFVALYNTGSEALAEAMLGRIRHRGPDDFCVRRIAGTGTILGHARLAIIGPESGRQPMIDGSNGLVVNGEIFNHRDLRAMLGDELFRTASDSETVLHLPFRRGPRWIDQLRGMFAFVLATPEGVIAGRDPLGIKPLLMARLGEGLVFASEVKAFDGMDVRDVKPLPPGALFDSRSGIVRHYFRMPAGCGACRRGDDATAIAAELRLVLEDAVEAWMESDVELGAFLSGGLDSSIICAIAARRMPAGRTLKTFAVGTADSPDLKAARQVAAHIGSDHHEFVFTASDLAEAMEEVAYNMETTDVDTIRSGIPTHFVARLARRYVKTVLTGEGADELFAGYRYHRDYAGQHGRLADELTRSLGTMHNINLQRVDRVTMGHGLEARTPFLDTRLIAFAQSIPAELKLVRDGDGLIEKWILRKACEDLLPPQIVWRVKAQFDEGSGTVDALESAVSARAAEAGLHFANADERRVVEGHLYASFIARRFLTPELVRLTAGTWVADRVA